MEFLLSLRSLTTGSEQAFFEALYAQVSAGFPFALVPNRPTTFAGDVLFPRAFFLVGDL